MLLLNAEEIASLAARLDRAERQAGAIAPLTDEIQGLDVEGAYKIQAELVRLKTSRGERIVGYKLGLTSEAKRAQMGVKTPILGVLTDLMRQANGGKFRIEGTCHPRIEPEIAFRIDRDLRGRPSLEEALAVCSQAAPALEIIDSRYKDFKFKLPDVIADNGSSCAYVLGPWMPLPPQDKLGRLAITLSVNGRVVEKGSSEAISGHPGRSVVELCGMLNNQGLWLKKDTVVLAGAATAAVPLAAGALIEASVEGLGSAFISAA